MNGLLRTIAALSIILAFSCSAPLHDPFQPMIVVWAWERPEDLRFLDPTRHAAAFLAQTLILKNQTVEFVPRRQPFRAAPGTYLIAVTRIETSRRSEELPALSASQRDAVIEHLQRSVKLPEVRAVQIDFDAVVSEREFYRALIASAREALGYEIPLTITALSSWCSGDRWMSGLPIDDAVPMLFDIGPQRKEITEALAKGLDWAEPVCRNSYGLSVNEPPLPGLKTGRRVYLFKNASWTVNDLERIEKANEN